MLGSGAARDLLEPGVKGVDLFQGHGGTGEAQDARVNGAGAVGIEVLQLFK